MSGIDQMKAKIKKKMTLGDLPVLEKSNVAVEEPQVNSGYHNETNIIGNMEHQDVNGSSMQSSDVLNKKSISDLNLDGWMDGNLEKQHPNIQETQKTRNPPSPKNTSYKMTFQLTENIYKAFNDLYAKRMLEGRKTEKSELICEAIVCLLKMEEQHKT